MNKIEKKQKFGYLYKESIIFILKILGGLVSTAILSIVIFLSTSIQLLDVGYIIVAITLIGYGLYFLVLLCFKIKRQMYLPLTPKELENNSIKSISDYNVFLMKYLHGYKITNKKIKNEITKTALLYLISSKDKEELFRDWLSQIQEDNRKEDHYWKICSQTYTLTTSFATSLVTNPWRSSPLKGDLPTNVQEFFGELDESDELDANVFYESLIDSIKSDNWQNIPQLELIQNWVLEDLNSINVFSYNHKNNLENIGLTVTVFNIICIITCMVFNNFK